MDRTELAILFMLAADRAGVVNEYFDCKKLQELGYVCPDMWDGLTQKGLTYVEWVEELIDGN